MSSTTFKLVGGIQVPRSDDRLYRALTLPNGLRALLVSDVHTETAAASLEVSVGSFDDTIPGLAHFLEHMCFLGTEKFPDENSFSAFLSEAGGGSNAYTASEATNYHCECVDSAAKGRLAEMLARFGSFFTCPLFTESATARELQQVDSEHAKNVNNDSWAGFELDKTLSNPAHPYHKFGTGNAVTLRDEPAAAGINVREALLAFHREHYYAERMTLAVLGSAPLDELEAHVRTHFGGIRSGGSLPPPILGSPYDGDGYSCLRISRVPVRDSRSVNVSWPLPSQQHAWRSKPGGYLSHLLGHEGPGSLLSTLIARGWAQELYAGVSNDARGFAIFDVGIDLTEAGLAAHEHVLALLYAYIGMLRAQGPQQWVWEEDALVRASKFRFASKTPAQNAVVALASSLALHKDVSFVISASRLVWDFDGDAITQLLNLCTPEAARTTLTAKALADSCTHTERWYGTKYAFQRMDESVVARLRGAMDAYEALTKARLAASGGAPIVGGAACLGDAAAVAAAASAAAAAGDGGGITSIFPPLTLPSPNAFIASDFTLAHPETAARRVAEEAGNALPAPSPIARTLEGGVVRIGREPVPVLLYANPGRTLWLHTDSFFGLPKVHFSAAIVFPAALASPRGCAILELHAALAEESMRGIGYAARLAGLSFSSTVTGSGRLSVSISGFSHRAGTLAKAVADALMSTSFSDDDFAQRKDALVRAFENSKTNQPYQHAMASTTESLQRPSFNRADDVLPEMRTIDVVTLHAELPALLASGAITMLVSGNASAADAHALASAFSAPFASAKPPPPTTSLGFRVACLPPPLVIAATSTQASSSPSSSTALLRLAFTLCREQPARNETDANAAVELVIQVGPTPSGPAPVHGAMVLFLAHVMSESFFDELRTKQALGYIVSAGARYDHGVGALRFIVQSTKLPARDLLARVEAYLAAFASTLALMPRDKFRSNIESVASEIAQANKSLEGEAGRLWDEIMSAGKLDFQRATHAAEALLALTQEEVVAFFRSRVAPGGERRRAIASLVHAGTAAAAGGAQVETESAVLNEAPSPSGAIESPSSDITPNTAAALSGDKVALEDTLAPAAAVADAGDATAVAPSTSAPLREVRVPLPALSQAMLTLADAAEGGVPIPATVAAAAFLAAGLPQLAGLCGVETHAEGTTTNISVVVDARRSDVFELLPLFPDLGALRMAAVLEGHKAPPAV